MKVVVAGVLYEPSCGDINAAIRLYKHTGRNTSGGMLTLIDLMLAGF